MSYTVPQREVAVEAEAEPVPWREAYARSREINREHGRSYYLATRLLPAAKRPHVHALYGFTRWADEIVDARHAADRNGAKRLERVGRRRSWPACAADPSPIPMLPAVLHTIAHVRPRPGRLRQVPAQHGDGPQGDRLPDLRRPARLHGGLGRGDRHDDAADPRPGPGGGDPAVGPRDRPASSASRSS